MSGEVPLDGGRGWRARKVKRGAVCREFEALRDRRIRAAEMFDRGPRQVDVAVALEVSVQGARHGGDECVTVV
ncbi:hypothetical protein [Nocardia sp. GAS34]|uniref:hypothetical protein n=1 Tax=unclassified Nocardia TaxID=2637762 RepID=UPI003D1A9295